MLCAGFGDEPGSYSYSSNLVIKHREKVELQNTRQTLIQWPEKAGLALIRLIMKTESQIKNQAISLRSALKMNVASACPNGKSFDTTFFNFRVNRR
jgi:hypothetical protein